MTFIDNISINDPIMKRRLLSYRWLYQDIVDIDINKTFLVDNIIKVDDTKKNILSNRIQKFICKKLLKNKNIYWENIKTDITNLSYKNLNEANDIFKYKLSFCNDFKGTNIYKDRDTKIYNIILEEIRTRSVKIIQKLFRYNKKYTPLYYERYYNPMELEYLESKIGLVPERDLTMKDMTFETESEFKKYVRQLEENHLFYLISKLANDINELERKKKDIDKKPKEEVTKVDNYIIDTLGVSICQYEALFAEYTERASKKKIIGKQITKNYDIILLKLALENNKELMKNVIKSMSDKELFYEYNFSESINRKTASENEFAHRVHFELTTEHRNRMTKSLMNRGWTIKNIADNNVIVNTNKKFNILFNVY